MQVPNENLRLMHLLHRHIHAIQQMRWFLSFLTPANKGGIEFDTVYVSKPSIRSN